MQASKDNMPDLLRFITCGSVDDGKSTLIGRLLHDSRQLDDDQLSTLAADSRRVGTQGEDIDYALLVDGLDAEREQGITIDVAYRHFRTPHRRFIVADCPGHVQYTRNMATGASTADLAVVLVDARKGLLPQTRRHSWIVHLFGIRQVVLAVNKMDLVDYDESVFRGIENEYRQLAEALGITSITVIPVSALRGDNLIAPSGNTPWHAGPSLLEALESANTTPASGENGFHLPVQWVSRPGPDFRGYAGTISSGIAHAGDDIVVLPGGQRTRLARIVTADGDLQTAEAGQAVTVTLTDEIDVARGDVIASSQHPPEVADQFAVHLLWMDDAPLLPGRSYWLKIGTRTVAASVTEIKHRIDVDTQAELAAREIGLNEVAVCNLSTSEAIPFTPYAEDRTLGGFILIDRQSNATVAAGTIDFALRRAANIHWQATTINQGVRASSLGQAPRCVWFTGLSGSGKSTIANLVEKKLQAMGKHAYILDGDNVRHGLNRDLGFTDADRVENIRRVAEVAKLMTDAGLIVLVSFISPFRAERQLARGLFNEGEFIEVFVDTPLEVAEARDAKGLYAKARADQIPNFTGIDSPYEVPQSPELILDSVSQPADALAEQVVASILK
ncbi:MAG: sulfate adenylyltransferase subunit CysN [Xanthomonadaceae bacterium]|nr:sulfate adenylyltransferase subunit CysN [Xanthomonadaceae bacterium]